MSAPTAASSLSSVTGRRVGTIVSVSSPTSSSSLSRHEGLVPGGGGGMKSPVSIHQIRQLESKNEELNKRVEEYQQAEQQWKQEMENVTQSYQQMTKTLQEEISIAHQEKDQVERQLQDERTRHHTQCEEQQLQLEKLQEIIAIQTGQIEQLNNRKVKSTSSPAHASTQQNNAVGGSQWTDEVISLTLRVQDLVQSKAEEKKKYRKMLIEQRKEIDALKVQIDKLKMKNVNDAVQEMRHQTKLFIASQLKDREVIGAGSQKKKGLNRSASSEGLPTYSAVDSAESSMLSSSPSAPSLLPSHQHNTVVSGMKKRPGQVQTPTKYGINGVQRKALTPTILAPLMPNVTPTIVASASISSPTPQQPPHTEFPTHSTSLLKLPHESDAEYLERLNGWIHEYKNKNKVKSPVTTQLKKKKTVKDVKKTDASDASKLSVDGELIKSSSSAKKSKKKKKSKSSTTAQSSQANEPVLIELQTDDDYNRGEDEFEPEIEITTITKQVEEEKTAEPSNYDDEPVVRHYSNGRASVASSPVHSSSPAPFFPSTNSTVPRATAIPSYNSSSQTRVDSVKSSSVAKNSPSKIPRAAQASPTEKQTPSNKNKQTESKQQTADKPTLHDLFNLPLDGSANHHSSSAPVISAHAELHASVHDLLSASKTSKYHHPQTQHEQQHLSQPHNTDQASSRSEAESTIETVEETTVEEGTSEQQHASHQAQSPQPSKRSSLQANFLLQSPDSSRSGSTSVSPSPRRNRGPPTRFQYKGIPADDYVPYAVKLALQATSPIKRADGEEGQDSIEQMLEHRQKEDDKREGDENQRIQEELASAKAHYIRATSSSNPHTVVASPESQTQKLFDHRSHMLPEEDSASILSQLSPTLAPRPLLSRSPTLIPDVHARSTTPSQHSGSDVRENLASVPASGLTSQRSSVIGQQPWSINVDEQIATGEYHDLHQAAAQNEPVESYNQQQPHTEDQQIPAVEIAPLAHQFEEFGGIKLTAQQLAFLEADYHAAETAAKQAQEQQQSVDQTAQIAQTTEQSNYDEESYEEEQKQMENEEQTAQ